MATPLNLSWQGSVGCLRLYRSDMSWQIVGVSGWGLCTESGNMGNYIRKKKNANKNITRKVWGHLHAHITCPPSQRDIRDPESNYLAGCLWLKDGLWPLSQWSDSMLPTVQTSPAANTWEAAIGYETAATRGFLPIARQFSNVKCLAASAPRLFCLTPYLT